MGGASRISLKPPRNLDEARAIQGAVAREVRTTPSVALDRVEYIAGADASYSPDGKTVHAAAVVLGLPRLGVLERRSVSSEVPFPYVPGFFAFREGPALVSAIEALGRRPDLLLVDGHGRAHPRRAGIASHVGVLLDIPTVGVAKGILAGGTGDLPLARGSASPILHRGEIVGVAVRTKAGSRPVYVSIGHGVDLETAMAAVLAATVGSRIPAPIREAHRVSRQALRDWLSTSL